MYLPYNPDSTAISYDDEGRLSRVAFFHTNAFNDNSSSTFRYEDDIIFATHYDKSGNPVSIDTVKLDASRRIKSINSSVCFYNLQGQLTMLANANGDTTFYQWKNGDMVSDSLVSPNSRSFGPSQFGYSQEPSQWVNPNSFSTYLAYGVPLYRNAHMVNYRATIAPATYGSNSYYSYDANQKVVSSIDSVQFAFGKMPMLTRYNYACD